jgi:hypothetical protein|uniref:Uncharacterized protein n=1 Tax=Zea mays TaxID=4577 RepID=A0A804NV00_MAIZE
MAAADEDDATWERAISAATKATSAPKILTLDGAVKSSTGRLPSAALIGRFAASLEEFSVTGAALSSLTGLPASRRFGASPSPTTVSRGPLRSPLSRRPAVPRCATSI